MCFYNLKPLWHVCSHSLRGKAHPLLRSIIKYHLVKILLFRQKSLQTMLQWFLLWAGRLENQREYQINYPNEHHLGNHQKHHPISKCSNCVKHRMTTRLNLTWQPYYFSDERTSKLFHPPVVCPPNFNPLQSSTFTQVRGSVLLLMSMFLLILMFLLMLMLLLMLIYILWCSSVCL